MWTGEGNPMSVRQSCRVLSVSPQGCFRILCVLRHCPSISHQRPSVKRTQDAACEASFWATRCHGNTNQTAACTRGAGRKWESRAGLKGMGSSKASCQSEDCNSIHPGLEMCVYLLKVLQGEQAMNTWGCNSYASREERKNNKSPGCVDANHRWSLKTKQQPTNNLLHDLTRKMSQN